MKKILALALSLVLCLAMAGGVLAEELTPVTLVMPRSIETLADAPFWSAVEMVILRKKAWNSPLKKQRVQTFKWLP